MFILEEPYISDFLIETINKNNFTVFKNGLTENKCNNLFDEDNFSDIFNSDEKVYTNSENSFEIIYNKLKNTNISKYISLCKNKTEFRKLLNSVYQDFFFREVTFEELSNLKKEDFKYPFVIKPSIGFLSIGVYTVYKPEEFEQTINKLKNSIEKSKGLFPKDVLASNKFIIEEYIEGDEYAIDVYFDENSNPVILNIYYHPFLNKHDVSDRLYVTSCDIITKHYEEFYDLLQKIGKKAQFKNFPAHIEVRKNKYKTIPIEANPLRFAGWCLCDLTYFAYGINPYEYYMNNKKPDWKNIKNDGVYAFVIAEVPDIKNKENVVFDIEALKKDIGVEIIEFRSHDYKTKPLFASLFVKAKSYDEIKHVLSLDTKKYVREKIAF